MREVEYTCPFCEELRFECFLPSEEVPMRLSCLSCGADAFRSPQKREGDVTPDFDMETGDFCDEDF